MKFRRVALGLFATFLCYVVSLLFAVNGAAYTSWRQAFGAMSLLTLLAMVIALARPRRVTWVRAAVAVAAVVVVVVLVRVDTRRQSDALAWPGFAAGCVALVALVAPRPRR